MPVKIMCAGCPKDEREPAEAAVKAALGQAAGSWTVSLVKIGRQWSLTVDGPDVKHKTMVVPEGGIKQAILEMLSRAAPPASAPRAPLPSTASTAVPRAPAPPTVNASRTTASPAKPASASPARAPLPAPARPAAAPAASPRAPLPPSRTAPVVAPTARTTASPAPPVRAPLAPTRGPSSSQTSGERHDRYSCQYCGGAFVVVYEASASSSQETVAVACPHCWKNSHVMVAEEAALSRDYRSEKA
jgi:DNA-directed RNA polymerase subunit RPC12/RpoP